MQDPGLCIKTWIVERHALSLILGDVQLTIACHNEIMRGIEEFGKLEAEIQSVHGQDLLRFTSKVNRPFTLSELKKAISDSAEEVARSIKQTRNDCAESVGQSSAMFPTHDEPTTLFAEMMNVQLL